MSSWQTASRTNKFLFWFLIVLGIVAILAVALAFRGFNREVETGKDVSSQEVSLNPNASNVVEMEKQELTGFVSEVIGESDASEKWIALSVMTPSATLPQESSSKSVEVKTMRYRFYLGKEIESAKNIHGGETVTIFFAGEPSEEEYVRAQGVEAAGNIDSSVSRNSTKTNDASSATTGPSSRQESMVASTNVFEAKIAEQKGNSLTVSFDLNNHEGVQTGVRYGINLVGYLPDGRTYLYDEQVYPEMLSLGADQTEHRSVPYEVPVSANGKFQVWVMAKNDAGLALGLGRAGEVEVSAKEGVSIQTTSCLANVLGEEKQYTLSQGVDIGDSDKLQVVCDAENMSNKPVSALLNLREFRRNAFSGGDGAKLPGYDFSFGPKEKKKISFDISVNREAQAYDVVAYFSDTSGSKVSNSVSIHYVSQGKSATLSNVIFDKSSYNKGDIARATLFITPSADRFGDSRGEGSVIGKLSASVQLNDASSGLTCSESASVDVDADRGGIVTKEIPITQDCSNPKVALSLMGDGQTLDARGYELQSDASTKSSETMNSRKNTIVIAVIVAFFAIVFAVGLLRGKKRGMAIFFIFFFGQFFLVTYYANADSFTVPGGPFKEANGTWGNMPDVTYTVGPNKRVYAPGETVTVTGIGYIGNCVNGNFYGFLSLSFPTAGTPYLISIQNGQWGGAGWYYGSTSFPAPSVPGRYWINFTGNSLYYFQAQYSLFIDVVQPSPPTTPPPACTPSCSAAPNYCLGIPFSDGCTGTCWGTQNCSPPPVPASPALTFTVKEKANPGNTTSNGGTITIPDNTSATLSWVSSNTLYCLAVTGSSNETWDSGNAISNPGIDKGPFPARATPYRYTLRCRGLPGTTDVTQTVSVNVSAPAGPPSDPVMSYACNPSGNSVTLTWGAVPSATYYALRINDLSDPWQPSLPTGHGSCADVTQPTDTCDDYVTATTFTRPVTPNQNYDAWIHACPAVGSCSPGKHIAPTPFKCVSPASVDLKANGSNNLTIPSNQDVFLTWNTSNIVAGSCSASGSWSGVKADSKSAPGENRGQLPIGTHTLRLTCKELGTNTDIVDSVTVTSTCVPTSCDISSNICQGESCNPGCSLPIVNGTKDCRQPWVEVKP